MANCQWGDKVANVELQGEPHEEDGIMAFRVYRVASEDPNPFAGVIKVASQYSTPMQRLKQRLNPFSKDAVRLPRGILADNNRWISLFFDKSLRREIERDMIALRNRFEESVPPKPFEILARRLFIRILARRLFIRESVPADAYPPSSIQKEGITASFIPDESHPQSLQDLKGQVRLAFPSEADPAVKLVVKIDVPGRHVVAHFYETEKPLPPLTKAEAARQATKAIEQITS